MTPEFGPHEQARLDSVVARMSSVLALSFVLVLALGGCVIRRAYSMSISLREEEKRGILQTIAQVASRMDCKFQPGDDSWHESGKSQFRVCEPAATPNTRVVYESQIEGSLFTTSVIEQNQGGPVRPDVNAYAEQMNSLLGELFGNDRISLKKSNWRL